MMHRILALFLLVMSLPIILTAILLILVFDGRPGFFFQERQGLHRKPFTIIKFRTMRKGQSSRIGKLLRYSGVDELPQLLNILRGEMVLIGPRPLTTEDVQRLGWQQSSCDWRWSVKPGISGLAQLTRICSSRLSLRLDKHYIDQKAWHYDLRIFFRSLCVPFLGKGSRPGAGQPQKNFQGKSR